jgi:hypothetical protein
MAAVASSSRLTPNTSSIPSAYLVRPIHGYERTLINIFYNVFYIGATVVKPFCGPFIPVVSSLQLIVSSSYYCYIFPETIKNILSSLRSSKPQAEKIPFKQTVTSFLNSINVFGPNKVEAITKLATITLNLLAWGLFIASVFVAPHTALIFCLTSAAISAGLGIHELAQKYFESLSDLFNILLFQPAYLS